MNPPHCRPDQPLNVAAEMRGRDGTEVQLDVVFAAATAKRFAAEISTIVGSQYLRQSAQRPLEVTETACEQPRLFWKGCLGKAHPDRGDRRWIQGHIEAEHAAAKYVDRLQRFDQSVASGNAVVKNDRYKGCRHNSRPHKALGDKDLPDKCRRRSGLALVWGAGGSRPEEATGLLLWSAMIISTPTLGGRPSGNIDSRHVVPFSTSG
jgi:hypothetical protein